VSAVLPPTAGPAIPYPWLSARARNSLRRHATISIASGIAFIVTLIGLILIPRQASHSAQIVASQVPPRPDTTFALRARNDALAAIARIDSSLVHARHRLAHPIIRPAVIDTFPPEIRLERDSLRQLLNDLTSAMTRAAESPLPPAFRELGSTPALRDNPNVKIWLDSLETVDKLRAPFGTLGAGDPIYVALTARVNELGRSLRDAATLTRSELRARLAPLMPVPPSPSVVETQVDTVPLVASRDSARQQYIAAARSLTAMRAQNKDIDATLTASRQLANIGAPPIAMLGAALVIALVFGFSVALAGELKQPRIAHTREAEAVAGGRVLAVIQPVEIVERGRRQSDLDAPPLIDLVSDSYRTLYLHLAAKGASIPIVTVAGEQSPIVATVATNLAAISAYEARSTLLVDADPATSGISAVLRIPSEPGLMGVLSEKSRWSESIVATTIGRDRPLDVLPSGSGRIGASSHDAVERVRSDLTRMERRYDFIVIAAPTSYVQLATETIIPTQDVVLCARVGHTRLAELRAAVRSLRGVGRRVHGVVLWNDEPPRI
jgi:Mrp family chromosome partitioning ATPase